MHFQTKQQWYSCRVIASNNTLVLCMSVWAQNSGATNVMVHVILPQDLIGDGLAHVTLLTRLIVQPVCLDSCDGGVANLVHEVLQGTNTAIA